MARTNVEAEAFLGEFRRYASILTSRVANDQQPKFDGESATAVQVERGIVYPRALLNPAALDISPADRLIELSNSPVNSKRRSALSRAIDFNVLAAPPFAYLDAGRRRPMIALTGRRTLLHT